MLTLSTVAGKDDRADPTTFPEERATASGANMNVTGCPAAIPDASAAVSSCPPPTSIDGSPSPSVFKTPATALSPARLAPKALTGRARISAGEPSSTTLPRSSTIMRVPSSTASATSWVTRTVVVPSDFSRSTSIAPTRVLASTSRAAVGSSRMSRRGEKTSARASATRAAWPPESWPPRRAASRSQPTFLSCSRASRRARARGNPRHTRGKATFANTVMCSNIRGFWLTIATPRPRGGMKAPAASTVRSPICTVPESSAREPERTSASVDFPAPLWPMTARTSPAPTSMETSHPRSQTVPAT